MTQIEQFGCSVVSVKRTSAGLGWTYTIGVYDTCGQPELITVGLPPDVAHFALDEAAKRFREGVDLAAERQKDLIGAVACEFRPVNPKWVQHLMGWALWYYDGTEFPVLQAVYPDLQNRFPEEDGFNPRFAQPMMQPGAAWTSVEADFWASADPKSSLFDWKFADSPHSAAFLSKTVHEGTEAVVYVAHDEDGDWQFLGDSMANGGGPVLVGLHHPIDKDPSLRDLADLPVGWCAEREQPGEPWVRHRLGDREKAAANSIL